MVPWGSAVSQYPLVSMGHPCVTRVSVVAQCDNEPLVPWSPAVSLWTFAGLEPLCSGARLRELELFSLGTTRLREMLELIPAPKGALRELEKGTAQWCGVTEEGGMAMRWRRAGFDGILGRNLPSEAGEALAQVTQRGCRLLPSGHVQGQVGWSNLLQWKVSLPMGGDWNWIIFRIPT